MSLKSCDQNGGLYWALRHENVLDHMMSCKVKYLHVYCVDNVLDKVQIHFGCLVLVDIQVMITDGVCVFAVP